MTDYELVGGCTKIACRLLWRSLLSLVFSLLTISSQENKLGRGIKYSLFRTLIVSELVRVPGEELSAPLALATLDCQGSKDVAGTEGSLPWSVGRKRVAPREDGGNETHS